MRAAVHHGRTYHSPHLRPWHLCLFQLHPAGQSVKGMAQKEKSPWSYKLTSKYEEIGSKEPVYCVTFNDVDPEHRMVFATCGNRRVCSSSAACNQILWSTCLVLECTCHISSVTLRLLLQIGVYKCQENGTIEPIQCYMDENVSFPALLGMCAFIHLALCRKD